MHDQEENRQRQHEEQEQQQLKKNQAEDDEALQRFLEDKLRDNQADRAEAAATRRCVAAVRDDPNSENILNLLTNYQGNNFI